ncbi:MAG: hypothetical protein ACLRL6_08230 [Clostridium sp.]
MLTDKKITIRTNKIRNETIEKMRSLGVYREEFAIPIHGMQICACNMISYANMAGNRL